MSADAMRPPSRSGPSEWMRRNLFRTWYDTVLTVVFGALALYVLARAIVFVFVDARWEIIEVNLKLLMVGARVTQLCSVLLQRGVEHIRVIERGLCEWMEENEYESVRQMQGSMSQARCPDPIAFERAQYMRTLHSYRPPRPEG